MTQVEIIKARLKEIEEQIVELERQREQLYFELDEELDIK